jgi:endoglucanase
MVAVRLEEHQEIALPAPVVFDLPDFSIDGDLVRMRAADDLAGCAATLAALHELAPNPAPGDVYGVFTRAEEVGLIGARLIAREGRLPQDCIIVSLESSRELPGAVIGGGPVIRVGDAAFTFNADAEQALHVARQALSHDDASFKAQRQLMSGGTCEASAFAAHGYAATGVAFPLGDYHNAAPEGGVAAEYIHVDDFLAGVRLVTQAARSVAERRGSPALNRLLADPERERRRLEGV